MKGEETKLPQCAAWAFMHSVSPGRIFKPDDALMRGTMAMLDANQSEGLIYGTGWHTEGIWNADCSTTLIARPLHPLRNTAHEL